MLSKIITVMFVIWAIACKAWKYKLLDFNRIWARELCDTGAVLQPTEL